MGLERLWCTCEAIWGQRTVLVSGRRDPWDPSPESSPAHIGMQCHLPGHKGQVAVRHNLGHAGVHEALHVCGDRGLRRGLGGHPQSNQGAPSPFRHCSDTRLHS